MKYGVKPGQFKSLPGNYRPLLAAILALLISTISFAQYDSTRIRQAINAYGYEWKNAKFNGSVIVPVDTPTIAIADTGAIAIKDNSIYTWSLENGLLYWKRQSGVTASISGDTLFINSDTLILATAFTDITGDAFDNINLYGYFYDRGLPKYATTGDLATVNVTVSDKVIVPNVGILEWSATGPADGVTYFTGLGGFWKVIMKAGKQLTYKNGIRIDGDTVKLDNIGTPSDGDQIQINAGDYDISLNGAHGAIYSKWHSYIQAYDSLYLEAYGDELQVSALLKLPGYYVDTSITVPAASDPRTTIFLDTIAANATVTFTDPPNKILTNRDGTLLFIVNTNNSAFTWGAAGNVQDGSGNTITTIDRGLWAFMYDGEKWIRQSGASGGTGSTTSNLYFENGATSTDLDSLVTSPNDSTVRVKSIGNVSGTFMNVTNTVGVDSIKWTVNLDTANAGLKAYIAANSGGGGGGVYGIDTVLATGDTLTTDRQVDYKGNNLSLINGKTIIGQPTNGTQIGTIWTDAFTRATLGADWTEVTPTTTLTVDGAEMDIVGGGSFTDYITYKDTTGFSRFRISANIITSADGNGVGWGMYDVNSAASFDLYFRFIMTGADKGKVRVYKDNSEAGGTVTTSTTALSYTNGDTLNIILERDDNTITITSTNLTTDAVNTFTYTYDISNTTNVLNGTSSVRFYFFGGTYSIDDISYSVQEKTGKYVFIGNSITTGYSASSNAARFASLIFQNRNRYAISNGSGDRAEQALSTLGEVTALAPAKVIYLMGVNDVRAGTNTATFSSQVQQAIAHYLTLTTDVLIVSSVPSNIADATPYNDTLQAIATRNGLTYVNTFDALRTGTAWNSTYVASDNIHPNDAGHQLIADSITAAIPEIAGLNIYESQGSVSPEYILVLDKNVVKTKPYYPHVELSPTSQQTGEVWTTDVLTDSLEVGTMPTSVIKGTATIGATTTSSAEYALRVVNSANTNLLTVKNDGTWFGVPVAEFSASRIRFAGSTQQITSTNTTTQTTAAINFTPNAQFRGTAGTQQNHIRVSATFDPTSGTAPFSELLFATTINQTGGANGITRAIHIAPTLTSAADFRAIDVITGKSYFRSVHLTTAGDKLNIATGSNASIGTATLVAGTVTVSTSAVTASSIIMISVNTPGGTVGYISAPAASIVAGTSFVINSSSATDTSTINWWIIN